MEAERVIHMGELAFNPPISAQIDIPWIAEKWSRYAKFLLLKDNDKIAATLVFYENKEGKFIYIPHLVVMNDYQHMGIGHYALNSLISLIGSEYLCIRLEVRKDNIQARKFYKNENFIEIENRENSYILEKKIND